MIIEVAGRHGRVLFRHKITSAPVTIGRAYDCDIIVDDEFVSPHHLRVYRNELGVVMAEDLGSRNGSYLRHPRRPLLSSSINNGDCVQIGHTTLRFRAVDAPVQEAKKLHYTTAWIARYANSWVFFVALAAVLLAATYESIVVADYQSGDPFKRYLSQVASVGAAIFAWALAWSIASRIVTHRFSMIGHLNIVCGVLACIYLTDRLNEVLQFSYAPGILLANVETLSGWLLVSVLLFLHLYFVTSWTLRRRGTIAAAVSGFVFAMGLLGQYADRPDFDSLPSLASPVLPAYLKLGNDASLSHALGKVNALKARVDKQAADAAVNDASPDAESTASDIEKEPSASDHRLAVRTHRSMDRSSRPMFSLLSL